MSAKQAAPHRKQPGLTLGLAGFSKISAVEGIVLPSESQSMFAEFDRNGLSPEERRRAILQKHARRM
jgi:hypothetical protein